MIISDVDLIALAFGAFNVLRLASYFPQIAAVARDQHGATAISFSCWSLWIGANASTAFYASERLGDPGLALISAFNAACCLSGPSLGRMEALVRPLSSINFATRQILRQRRKHGGGLTCELVRCRQS